jgi:hypothetical protein
MLIQGSLWSRLLLFLLCEKYRLDSSPSRSRSVRIIHFLSVIGISQHLKKIRWDDSTDPDILLEGVNLRVFLVFMLVSRILVQIHTFLFLTPLLMQVRALPLISLHLADLSEVEVRVPRCCGLRTDC